jgi:PAS domain S-box-containing protein
MIKPERISNIIRDNYELITESIKELILIINKRNEIEYTNKIPVIKSLGYQNDELLGKSWLNYVYYEDLERAILLVEKSDEINSETQELRLLDKNEKIRTFECICRKINGYFDRENIMLMLKDITDITERRIAELKFQESEKQLKDLLEVVPVGISITTPEGKIIECNSHLIKAFGCNTKEELMETPVRDYYYDPRDRDRFLKIHKSGSVKDFEVKFKRKDGSIFWGLLTSIKHKFRDKPIFINSFQDITDRKKTEIIVQQSEAELAAIYDYTPIAILLLDNERRIRKINQFALQFTDRREEEVFGVHGGEALRCLYSIDNPRGCGFSEQCQKCVIRNTVLDTFKSKKPHINVEATLYLLPGGVADKVHLLFSSVLLNVEGEDRVLVSMIDITERKITEQKLIISEEKYRTLIQNIPGMIYRGNPDWTTNFISNSKVISGFTEEDFMSHKLNWIEIIHPNDKQFVVNGADLLTKKPRSLSQTYRIITKKGDIQWVNDRKISYFNDNGEFSGVDGVVYDITEHKEAELKLKESEELYQDLYEKAPNAYLSISSNGLILMCNSAAENLLDYSREELLKKNFLDLYINSKKGIHRAKKKLKMILSGEVIQDEELQMKKRNGLPLWVSLTVKPIFGENGNVKESRVMVVDISRRKKAEQKLKIIDDRLKYLASSGPAVIYTAKSSGDYGATFISENVKDLTGYEPEEFIKNPELWIDNVHPEDKALVLSKLSHITEEKSLGYEYRFKFKNGIYHWMRDESKLIYDDKGNYLEMVGSWSDITWSKKTEEKIQYQAKLVENVSDAIISTDFDFKIITWNKAAELIYGWRAEDIIGKKIKDTIKVKYSNDTPKNVVNQVFEEGFWKGEVIQPRKDGTPINILASVSLIKDINGSPIGVVAINHDITDRKRAEIKLKESEEKFRNIAEQTSLGLLIEQDGFIKFANSAVADLSEYSLQEINSWTIEDVKKTIHKEDLPLIITKLRNAERDDYDDSDEFECRIFTKSGTKKWIEIIAKPIIYLGKKAIFSSLVDITAKKKLEEELKEISRLKSELLSRTSHELKTPLVSIKGYADLLLTQHYEELDFYTISILHEIKQGCSRLESLIKDLLETSKLESGEIKLIKTEEDLAFLIRFCIRDLKGLLEIRNHELILDLNSEMITHFEKERIYEVVMNLISNAIKYTPKNGKIIIRSEIQNGNYVISVQDTGIGLTSEEKTKIFKKFGKVERYGQGLDVVSEGSGLGLYISKKIIELHEGNMWVESEGRKKGSIFCFSLPIIKNNEKK